MKNKNFEFKIRIAYAMPGLYFFPTTEDRVKEEIFFYENNLDYYSQCRESAICELQIIDDRYESEKRKNEKRMYTGIFFGVDGRDYSLKKKIRTDIIFNNQAAINARKILNIVENYMGWSKTKVSKVKLNEYAVNLHEKVYMFLFNSSPFWRTSPHILSLYYLLIRISVYAGLLKDINDMEDLEYLLAHRAKSLYHFIYNNRKYNYIYDDIVESQFYSDLYHTFETIHYWRFLFDNFKTLFRGKRRIVFNNYSHTDGIATIAKGNSKLFINERNKKLYDEYREKMGLNTLQPKNTEPNEEIIRGFY